MCKLISAAPLRHDTAMYLSFVSRPHNSFPRYLTAQCMSHVIKRTIVLD